MNYITELEREKNSEIKNKKTQETIENIQIKIALKIFQLNNIHLTKEKKIDECVEHYIEIFKESFKNIIRAKQI